MKKLLVAVALIAAFGLMMVGCKKEAAPKEAVKPPVTETPAQTTP